MMNDKEFDIYERIEELGIKLCKPSISAEFFISMVEFGDSLVYTSGTGCSENGVLKYKGKLGAEVDLEQGQWSARQCIVNILSNFHHTFGNLNRIGRVVKLLGFVASSPDFSEQTSVMNGASRVLIDIWGTDLGKSARSAIGVTVLPKNQPVEIEAIFELKK